MLMIFIMEGHAVGMSKGYDATQVIVGSVYIVKGKLIHVQATICLEVRSKNDLSLFCVSSFSSLPLIFLVLIC